MTLTPKDEAVLDLIQQGTDYENYFFRKVTDVKWFLPLKEKGFFAPEKVPSPEPAEQEGLFRIPEWNVLPYLERISMQVNTPGSAQYVDELLAIIKDVSNYRDASSQHIDNYRTWNSFITILISLPTEKISYEVINFIPIWLNSKFSTSLPGSEIALKLLPKFLNGCKPEDWKKAERIIEIITDVKWVPIPEKEGSIFEKDQKALTLVEFHWLKETIEKHAERIGAICSIDVINTIAKRLLNILGRNHTHSCDICLEGKDYLITHVLHEYGSHQVLLYLFKYPEGWDGVSRDKIEKTLILRDEIPEFEKRIEFVRRVKKILVDKAFPKLTTEIDEQLSSIYYLGDYSYIWYESLSDSKNEKYIHDTEGLFTYIIKELLPAKSRYDSAGIGKLLEQFLGNEYPFPLFKRFVLFVASREWEKFKEYFLKLIQSEEISCFDESHYRAEISDLLKTNFKKFDNEEKEIIKRIILAGPQFISPENPDPEKYKAYWKQKWLYPLKGDPYYASLYEEQRGITGSEETFWGIELEAARGSDVSPLTVEEILRLSNAELALKMKEFKSERTWGGKTVNEFAITLKDAVKFEPKKFIDNLMPFEDVGFIYIYKILDGLKDAWVEKKEINWGNLLDFTESYIKKEQFLSDEFIVEKGEWRGGADHEWVINMIAYLIQEGTKDDAWAFSEKYFEKAKGIIFFLLKEPEENEDISDYINYALNTPCGNLITALVYLALRIARVNAKKGIKAEPRWSGEYKGKFDELLKRKVVEAYVHFGRLLPNFAYLDNEWVKDNLKKISSGKGSKYWEAFMDGYLSIGKVYEDFYDLIKSDYEFGLSYDFKGKSNRKYLIQHISVAYLIGQEDLSHSESLFKKIVDKENPEQIREIIEFFRMQGYSEKDGKTSSRIIDFWRRVYRRYEPMSAETFDIEDKRILSDVANLSAFLPLIDDESHKWLMLSASYLNEGYNAHSFIEHLEELKNRGEQARTARHIGEIYLKMLQKITPDYDQAHIRSIVEFLYQAGEKVNASEVCNIYERKGYGFLRDIYEKHSDKL